jgi:hypothetical protein
MANRRNAVDSSRNIQIIDLLQKAKGLGRWKLNSPETAIHWISHKTLNIADGIPEETGDLTAIVDRECKRQRRVGDWIREWSKLAGPQEKTECLAGRPRASRTCTISQIISPGDLTEIIDSS